MGDQTVHIPCMNFSTPMCAASIRITDAPFAYEIASKISLIWSGWSTCFQWKGGRGGGEVEGRGERGRGGGTGGGTGRIEAEGGEGGREEGTGEKDGRRNAQKKALLGIYASERLFTPALFHFPSSCSSAS